MNRTWDVLRRELAPGVVLSYLPEAPDHKGKELALAVALPSRPGEKRHRWKVVELSRGEQAEVLFQTLTLEEAAPLVERVRGGGEP